MGNQDNLSPDIESRIRDSFAAQSMMATLGAQLVTLARGAIRIEAPILPGSLQQHGFGHAGLTFAIGDSAAGYAALSILPAGSEVLTAEMKINLLAPAKGPVLRAQGRVVKPGRRLVIVEADVHSLEADGPVHVARLMGTMVPLTA